MAFKMCSLRWWQEQLEEYLDLTIHLTSRKWMVPQQIAMIILSWSQANLIFPYHWSSPSSIDRGIRVLRDQFTGLCLGSIAQNWKICRDVRNLWKTVQKDGSSCHLNWKQPLAPTFFQNWWQWKTLAALLKDGKTHMTLTTKFPTRMAWF